MTSRFGASWLFAGALAVAACTRGSDSSGLDPYGDGDGNGDGDGDGDGDDDGDGDGDGDHGTLGDGEFKLTADFDGPCEVRDLVDVDLGHTAESAVRALHCQIFGKEPGESLVSEWAGRLRSQEYVRRIDVARSLCREAGRDCQFGFSDPWQEQIDLTARCDRRGARDLGAVLMYFSECPRMVNCDMYWASSHALGMSEPHVAYGFGSSAAGYYHPANAGFWRRELLDARWAGLQFLVLNTYGPDMSGPFKPLERAVEALDDIGGGIGLALMDDTWSWGKGPGEPWTSVPNLDDTEGAASVIYQSKWKPFFEAIPEKYWYEYAGKPLVYFYNAGTLEPRNRAPAVIARLKQMFASDFGVEPFVAVDSAFFEDEAAMNAVANARFTWDTFKYGASSSELGGVKLRHAMVRWDAVGRDRPGELANASDRMHKGPALLEDFLSTTSDANIAVIATWNDLGEGTGIHRNYDYSFGGEWLSPHHFLSLIRESQCDASASSSSSSSD